MYWQEDKTQEVIAIPDHVVDMAFSIECRTLPVDHAHALAAAIRQVLPWFTDAEQAGLHVIHGADSGNGWERPSGSDDLLYLSRRSKMTLRLPKHRVENARLLIGHTLDVAGHPMKITAAKELKLSLTSTLYARYVLSSAEETEEQFIARCVQELQDLGLHFKKVLAGKQHRIRTPAGDIMARSLMIADLPVQDAVRLQETGLGPYRTLGLGLFIPHKSIKKVQPEQ